jgi:hypothetical protein
MVSYSYPKYIAVSLLDTLIYQKGCVNCQGIMKNLVKAMRIKNMKFRAKVSRMGDKIHIIIPKSYHKDIERLGLLDEFVDVELVLQT